MCRNGCICMYVSRLRVRGGVRGSSGHWSALSRRITSKYKATRPLTWSPAWKISQPNALSKTRACLLTRWAISQQPNLHQHLAILCFKRHFKIRECKCCLLQFHKDFINPWGMILKETYTCAHRWIPRCTHTHTHTPNAVTEELLKEISSFSKTSDQNNKQGPAGRALRPCRWFVCLRLPSATPLRFAALLPANNK